LDHDLINYDFSDPSNDEDDNDGKEDELWWKKIDEERNNKNGDVGKDNYEENRNSELESLLSSFTDFSKSSAQNLIPSAKTDNFEKYSQKLYHLFVDKISEVLFQDFFVIKTMNNRLLFKITSLFENNYTSLSTFSKLSNFISLSSLNSSCYSSSFLQHLITLIFSESSLSSQQTYPLNILLRFIPLVSFMTFLHHTHSNFISFIHSHNLHYKFLSLLFIPYSPLVLAVLRLFKVLYIYINFSFISFF
jgi:hypothetical protein